MRPVLFLGLCVLTACGGDTGGAASGGGGSGGGTDGGSVGGAGSGGAGGGSGGSAAGAGAGGSAGAASGGSAGTAGSGGAGSSPECTQASDCKLFQDCCSCQAVPSAEQPPMCKMACTTERCDALGASAKDVACVAGRCVMGFECDPKDVTCKIAVPQCPPGQVPEVSGSCYTQQCVPADECRSVASCADCAQTDACVSYVAQLGPQHHCVSVPSCGAASCACLGPTVCVGVFNACSDQSGVEGVTCGCPTC